MIRMEKSLDKILFKKKILKIEKILRKYISFNKIDLE